jgi:hypothetical protein
LSANLDAILANFRETIEDIVSHTDRRTDVKGFVWFDDNRIAPDQTSGMTRAFNVKLLSTEMPDGVTDLVLQQSEALVSIAVVYDRGLELFDRHRLIARDRFDLIKALRNSTDSSIGLDGRIFLGDEITEGQSIDLYRQKWRVLLQEVE